MNPGGVTNALKCGWHTTCLYPYSWGNALDWGNFGGQPVYWRSFGIATPNPGVLGTARPRDASSAYCYITSMDIFSLNGTFRGTAAYEHTTITTSSSVSIGSGSGVSPYETVAGPIGTTASSEKSPSCPWEAAHLHQYSTAAGW